MFKTNVMPLFEAPNDGGSGGGAQGGQQGSWWAGASNVPPEYIGHWQTTGLDKKTPVEAAMELTKSYMEARKHIGVHPSEIVHWPKDAGDEQRWQAVRTRLGVPTDKNQYDEGLKAVKRSNGQPVDQADVDHARELAAKLHLPSADAPSLIQGIVEDRDRRSASELAEKTAKIAESMDQLRKDWGANYNVNHTIAKQTAEKLGLKRATVEALENASSPAEIYNMFLRLGQVTGEDKLVLGGTGPDNNGVMTKEQAEAEYQSLVNDQAWITKWRAGDKDAMRHKANLDRLRTAA